MRLTLKHQILLAPATVLLLMALLLGALQYTYWDLSLKRQEASRLKTIFIALAEADIAAKGMLAGAAHLKVATAPDPRNLEELNDYYNHLEAAAVRLQETLPPDAPGREQLVSLVTALDPERDFDSDRIIAGLNHLRPQLALLAELTQKQRERLRNIHNQDIEELVGRTTFLSIIVLGIAILLGVVLSLTFAQRILSRIQALSASAGRIAGGVLEPPPAPERPADELDDLAISIQRMTARLIRVVSTEKLLEGAEEERRRIARDIHDQTLGDLSTVLRGLQELQRTAPAAAEARRLTEELQHSISSLREVMDDLHPQILDILGLAAALQSHLDKQRLHPGAPDYDCHVAPDVEDLLLPRLTQVTLYRIATEALHNVVKHAAASHCEVRLHRDDSSLHLSVEDDGRGLSQPGADFTGGRGLNNIRERARAIGAEVAWTPAHFATGTRFTLTLPLPSVTPAD